MMNGAAPTLEPIVPDEARGRVRILVCGGRDYADRLHVFNVLDRFHQAVGIQVVFHGAAKGADTLAGEWAAERGVLVEAYPAAWETYGNAAGAIRNARMLRDLIAFEPRMVIAFPGGRGTADMVRRAFKAGVRVLPIPPAT